MGDWDWPQGEWLALMALTGEPLYSEPRSQFGEWGELMKKIVLAAFIGILGISPLAEG